MLFLYGTAEGLNVKQCGPEEQLHMYVFYNASKIQLSYRGLWVCDEGVLQLLCQSILIKKLSILKLKPVTFCILSPENHVGACSDRFVMLFHLII